MQEQVPTNYHPSDCSRIPPPHQPLSNLNSALLFLNVAQAEFSYNSGYWCDIEILKDLLVRTRDQIKAQYDKVPNLSRALLRTSVFEESTSTRWDRVIIANDTADLILQTEALHSAGIEFIVGSHKPWKARSGELWLMVPSQYYSRAVACIEALPQKSNCITMGG